MKLLLLVCIIALTEGRRPPTLWKLEKPCWNEKKCRNCDGRCVKEEKVQCLRDPCEDSPCGDEEMCVANYCGECSACCLEPKECNKQSRVCEDGSEVFRDPFNNCRFPKCPSFPACTEEAKLCPNGKSVTRNPKNNCEFDPCVGDACKGCESALKCPSLDCPNAPGSCYGCCQTCVIGNDGTCTGVTPVEACPSFPACTEEAKLCPNGKSVTRNPKNNCEFDPCVGDACTDCESALKCASLDCPNAPGSCYGCCQKCVIGNDGTCTGVTPVEACPSFPACTEEAKLCPNGKSVTRNPKNNCEFDPCVGDACKGCESALKCPSLDCPNAPGSCYGCCQKCVIGNDGTCTGVTPVEACPSFPACTEEAKLCPNGKSVTRNPKNNCEFDPCVGDACKGCESALKCPSLDCPNAPGSCYGCCQKCVIGNDGTCTGVTPVEACPSFPACTEEAKLCPNGKYVSRNPKNNCEFDPCVGDACKGCESALKCPSLDCPNAPGSCYGCCQKCVIGNDGTCTGVTPVEACPSFPACTEEAKLCPNGKYVSRNPKNNCEFDPCVGDACKGCESALKCPSLDCPNAPGSCYGCCQKCVIGNDGTCTGVTPVEACPVDTH